MRAFPAITSWKITCRFADQAQALQQWLASRIDLDRNMTDTVRTVAAGVEELQTVSHRLGDYFSEIRFLPDPQASSLSFGLVFQRRPEAGRFSKDLMVNILREVEATPPKPSIELISKGELEAAAPSKAP